MKLNIKDLTTEPKQVSMSGYNAVYFEIVLPSGALLKLNPGQVYTTSDRKDLEFLSGHKGLSVSNIGDAEYRRHFTKLFSELPTVFNKNLSDAEAMDFMWSTTEENLIVEALRKRGYKISEPEVETESGYATIGDDKEKIKRIHPVKSTPKKGHKAK